MDERRIQVETGALLSVAQELDRHNQAIEKEFIDLETAVWKLRQDWSGVAYIKSCEFFDRIKFSYQDARKEALSKFTNALRHVADVYEGTENKVHTSVSAFK